VGDNHLVTQFEYGIRPEHPTASPLRQPTSPRPRDGHDRGHGQGQPQRTVVTPQRQAPPLPLEQLKLTPEHLVSDDVDPFEQSYMSDNLPVSQDLQLSSLSQGLDGGSEQHLEESDARRGGATSAELNRKEPLPYVVDSESEREEGDIEEFPGSGFF